MAGEIFQNIIKVVKNFLIFINNFIFGMSQNISDAIETKTNDIEAVAVEGRESFEVFDTVNLSLLTTDEEVFSNKNLFT